MKKKLLIAAVSATVLLVAGMLLKSVFETRQSVLLNQNIEALAEGDFYFLSPCRMPNAVFGPLDIDYFCDFRTWDGVVIYDCLGWGFHPKSTIIEKCVGEVKPQ